MKNRTISAFSKSVLFHNTLTPNVDHNMKLLTAKRLTTIFFSFLTVLQTQVVLAPTHFPNTVDDMIVLKSLPHEMKYYNYTYAHDITKQNTTEIRQSITLLMSSVNDRSCVSKGHSRIPNIHQSIHMYVITDVPTYSFI